MSVQLSCINFFFLSRFYTYGDLPLECHLEQIENKALRHFDKISVSTGIPPEPRWSQPVSKLKRKLVICFKFFTNFLLVNIVFKIYCLQRETFVTCPVDPMAPNPDKQSAVGLHYLTGRLVFYHDETVVINSDNIDSHSGL